MQSIVTKMTIGFLLLGLIIGTGITFMVNTANLNGITPDQILTTNQYEENAQSARLVVQGAENQSRQSGIDANDPSDIGAARDTLSVADQQMNIFTVISSFFDDLSQLLPVSPFIIYTVTTIFLVIIVAMGIYVIWGRNP